MFTHQRPGLDLCGAWKFCPDPMQRCRRQKWWRNPSKPDAVFPCWDVEGLWDIQVPGTWKTQFTELAWYDGHAVYLRDFALDAVDPEAEYWLAFDGVVYTSEVHLNGHHVGRHDWGYAPHRFRVTDMLQPGANRLFVLVDNHLAKERVPGEIFDWNNDGGIIAPVRLVRTPRVHVENFRVATRLDGGEAEITVEIHLAARAAGVREQVTVAFPGLGLSACVEAEAGTPACVRLRAPLSGLRLWSPDDPCLHRITVATRHETLGDEVGLREIRCNGPRLLLNGAPIRLHGVCVHAEFPGTGRAATADGIATVIAKAKALGFNFLRCAHYPYAESWGRALDRAGLLWWQEVPAYWMFHIREDGPARKALGMLDETVRRDWNRASLVIWSPSNECCWRNPEDLAEHNYAYWAQAVALLRRLDPSRLISCAEAQNFISTRPIWNPGQADEFQRRAEEAPFWRPMHSDEWYRQFDILSANLYVDLGEAEVVYARFVELMGRYGKPLMISEFGSMSLRGSTVAPERLGSERRHARLLSEAYAAFARLPAIVGTCPWCLADGRAPIHWRWYNQGKGLYRYGLYDQDWIAKEPVQAAIRSGLAALKGLP
ncbi:MAG: hypothetical protein L6R48_07915 [Planctomycetes bacterium]|nr:hypothetical protein [Planctomycetota bacterium]